MRIYLALVAAACIVGAVWLAVRRWSVLVDGVDATGRVEGFEERESEGTVCYLPIVSFTDRHGRARRFTSVAGRETPSPPVGSRVTVRYLRDDPGRAYIASFLHMWAAPVGFAVMGAFAAYGAFGGH